MEKQFEISVIIPIHNSENFIEKIYSNLNHQNFQNFEVLLVNDHSTDNTVRKLKEVFKKFTNEWRIFNSPNFGVSAARNIGIENAHAKYIAFIDDDDEISEDYLSILYANAKNSNAEIVLGSYMEIFNTEKVLKLFKKNVTYNSLDIRKKIIPQTVFSINNEEEFWLPVWRSLIQKNIIRKHNIKFDEKISQAEDFIFMLELLFKAKKISLVSEKPIYFYNRRTTSSMNRYIVNDLSKQLYFHKNLVKILQENKLFTDVKYRYLSNRLRMYSTVISNAARSPKKNQIMDEIKDTQKCFKHDRYLNKVSFRKLYNPLSIKILMMLLKGNHVNILYRIYIYKEEKRLRKFVNS